MIPPPPRSTLFPYTTLFRSGRIVHTATPSDWLAVHPAGSRPCGSDEPTHLPQNPLAATKHDKRQMRRQHRIDRKSTRLNSSHPSISYAVFCLKKKTDDDGAG